MLKWVKRVAWRRVLGFCAAVIIAISAASWRGCAYTSTLTPIEGGLKVTTNPAK